MHQTSDLIPSTDRRETERKERERGGGKESQREREKIFARHGDTCL
jgi:hypothetical protein